MKHLYILIITIIALFLIFRYEMSNMDVRIEKDYNLFNQKYIDNKIEYVTYMHHGIGFKLQNDSLIYSFYPYTDKVLNNGMEFENVASKGDRIIKPSFSDTLILIKFKKVYKYKFRNPLSGNSLNEP